LFWFQRLSWARPAKALAGEFHRSKVIQGIMWSVVVVVVHPLIGSLSHLVQILEQVGITLLPKLPLKRSMYTFWVGLLGCI